MPNPPSAHPIPEALSATNTLKIATITKAAIATNATAIPSDAHPKVIIIGDARIHKITIPIFVPVLHFFFLSFVFVLPDILLCTF